MTYLIDTLFYATVFFKFDFLTRMVLFNCEVFYGFRTRVKFVEMILYHQKF